MFFRIIYIYFLRKCDILAVQCITARLLEADNGNSRLLCKSCVELKESHASPAQTAEAHNGYALLEFILLLSRLYVLCHLSDLSGIAR